MRSVHRLAVGLVMTVAAAGAAAAAEWHEVPPPDQSDWSAKRLQTHARLDSEQLGEPLAVVTIADLGVAARVYDDRVAMGLEGGAVWVAGTALPGKVGNIVIAGHRDSYFRPLENIPAGTEIVLTTASGSQQFLVTGIRIVDALDTDPLRPSEEGKLTLITCFPFRYRGFAPDRYIVTATLAEPTAAVTQSVYSVALPGADTPGADTPGADTPRRDPRRGRATPTCTE